MPRCAVRASVDVLQEQRTARGSHARSPFARMRTVSSMLERLHANGIFVALRRRVKA
jgi:hypothetical protein